MTVSFWKGKRVFLTGHTGFKGSWLSLWLQKLGANVTGFSLPPSTSPSLFEAAAVDEGMHSVFGDIRDGEQLKQVMSDVGPEIVIHMAAQALVRESYVNPVDTYSINVMGTVNVLDAVRTLKTVKSVLVVTSDKCYENKEWVWGYREIDPVGGYDPYSSSKACAELIAASYRSSFFNPADHKDHGVSIATARAGNVIGGGDWSVDRLIPDVVSSIESGQTVKIRNPDAIRPWQHVLEPLFGYLTLCERLYEDNSYAGAWNFGPSADDAKSVGWIVEQLFSKWGLPPNWEVRDKNALHEAHYLKLDCSKSQSLLKAGARWNLDEALSSIVEWQKAYIECNDCKDATLSQISRFEETIS